MYRTLCICCVTLFFFLVNLFYFKINLSLFKNTVFSLTIYIKKENKRNSPVKKGSQFPETRLSGSFFRLVQQELRRNVSLFPGSVPILSQDFSHLFLFHWKYCVQSAQEVRLCVIHVLKQSPFDNHDKAETLTFRSIKKKKTVSADKSCGLLNVHPLVRIKMLEAAQHGHWNALIKKDWWFLV